MFVLSVVFSVGSKFSLWVHLSLFQEPHEFHVRRSISAHEEVMLVRHRVAKSRMTPLGGKDSYNYEDCLILHASDSERFCLVALWST